MQRNTQLVLLAVILSAGFLLAQSFVQQENNKTNSHMSTLNPPELGSTVLDRSTERLADRSAVPLTEVPATQKIDGAVNLWTTSNNNPDIDIPAAQKNTRGAVQIQYNTNQLRNLQYGDDLLIEVPQKNTRYRLKIKKVVNHPGGIKVVQARQNDDVRLILTLGQKNTFANLATLDGNFELVGNTSSGWLMPAENMDPDLNPSIPDFVVLPQSQAQIQNQIQKERRLLN